jgi:hypothetical protein
MTQHNVGALVVVKPGEAKSIAGIVTERGNEQISVLLASNSWPVGMMEKYKIIYHYLHFQLTDTLDQKFSVYKYLIYYSQCISSKSVP